MDAGQRHGAVPAGMGDRTRRLWQILLLRVFFDGFGNIRPRSGDDSIGYLNIIDARRR